MCVCHGFPTNLALDASHSQRSVGDSAGFRIASRFFSKPCAVTYHDLPGFQSFTGTGEAVGKAIGKGVINIAFRWLLECAQTVGSVG